MGFHLYPREISLSAYKMVFANEELYQAYGNTIARTVLGTAGALIVTSMFAYPMSRSHMPLKRPIMLILIFAMLFDGGIIPLYLLIKNFGLIDNRLVYILPSLISAYNCIILINSFKALPESLMESAKLDGASEMTILFRIIIPLSKPVLATVGLWAAVGHWNTWMDGLLYINSNDKQILQIFLQRIVKQSQLSMESGLTNVDVMSYTSETITSATIMVTILPILLVYPYIQKYFVKGIMLGSVKG
ncbi:MAG: carbohydrate ABC transporter permease [Clostridia bacterium]|nr:carbohydrate ABC transporter permease [Clostridia bacterium]